MKKFILLPLDERPCNYKFATKLSAANYQLILPSAEILGDKKKAGDTVKIKQFLLDSAKTCDGVILSVDMLLYGGIVPSRLHHLTEQEIDQSISFIKQLKQVNSKLIIYAFQLIMRCPTYSSDDEEPSYYAHCGAQIHQLGRLEHLESLGKLSAQDIVDKARLKKEINQQHYNDYLSRRQKNLMALTKTISLVDSGTIDYLVIPQDDSAPYGYTAIDQQQVRGLVEKLNLAMRVSIYPGADEVGLTLLSKMLLTFIKQQPKFFVHYASSSGANVIPDFEDRIIDESIKYQIYAAGGCRVYSLEQADIMLAVNIGNTMNGISPGYNQPASYAVNRNLCEFIQQIKYALSLNKAVAVCDVAFANNADIQLIKLLISQQLIFKINSYAGWNTSSNSIGTAICQCVTSVYAADNVANQRFTLLRLLEDYCYATHTRTYITENILPQMGLNYFCTDGKNGEVAKLVRDEILLEASTQLGSQICQQIYDIRVSMPWSRMFEVDIDLLQKQ